MKLRRLPSWDSVRSKQQAAEHQPFILCFCCCKLGLLRHRSRQHSVLLCADLVHDSQVLGGMIQLAASMHCCHLQTNRRSGYASGWDLCMLPLTSRVCMNTQVTGAPFPNSSAHPLTCSPAHLLSRSPARLLDGCKSRSVLAPP